MEQTGVTGMFAFWKNWGLVARLMAAVGFAIVAGGLVQSGLLVAEGATEHTVRLQRDMEELLNYLAPVVADQALVGDYAAVEQILKKQVKRVEVERVWWSDTAGRTLSAQDSTEKTTAPGWFAKLTNIEVAQDTSVNVEAGGVSYGKLHGRMYPINAQNRLWQQFVKQLQIVAATLLLMLQFIWLIFRGNLGTLRNLATGANRFSQGDHAVRIESKGAPEVRLAADAFNNMATNTQNLLTSLGESESKNRLLASIVEQSSEAIWTTDRAGVVTSWNTGAATMFGIPAAEAIGHPRRLDPVQQTAENTRMLRLIKLEKFSYDSTVMTRAGEQIDIQVAVAPLVGEDGQCVGTVSVARDVTERNRNDEALRAARASAESANLAKSAFLARMSHEIRTPMNGVLGMTELMLDTELTSVQRKYAETVHRSGTALLGIINDVLDFSKIEAGKLDLESVPFDLRQTVEDVVDMLAERAHAKGLDLGCSLPATLPQRVLGDPLRVGQILTNLTGNAIKFTEKGSVLISVSSVEDTPETLTIRFNVADTGMGISAEAQGRIFEEFSQADGSTTRQHGGSGLGLAISKQLVEMMGGAIHVDSKPGAGSTFWFTAVFKKQAASTVPATGVDLTAPVGALTGVRTLIIEFNAFGRGILQEQMAGWGMSTQAVESPEQGLKTLQHAVKRGVPFDLVVVDLGVAGGDALKFAAAVRAEPIIAKIKLAMLAPVGNHAMVPDARRAGLDACLVKPVRQSSLYDMMVNVMSGLSMLDVAAAPSAGKVDALVPVQARGSILLVEDNVVNQTVALGMLNKLRGYEVKLATNGREAVEIWSTGKFDLVLMDCHMPEMDGFQASREIRKREGGAARIPIVALTANAMAQDREECMNAGMNDHLGKPFSSKQLQEVLDRWMPARRVSDAVVDALLTQPPSSGEVLNRQALEQLRDLQTQEDPNLLARVIGLYLQDAPREMGRLNQAIHEQKAADVKRSAHTLKSASANIGAVAMSECCARLEALIVTGKLEVAGSLNATIAAEYERVKTELEAELSKLKRG